MCIKFNRQQNYKKIKFIIEFRFIAYTKTCTYTPCLDYIVNAYAATVMIRNNFQDMNRIQFQLIIIYVILSARRRCFFLGTFRFW